MADPITKDRVKKFVKAWYRALDRHAPVQECYKMLADDSLAMYFPDTVIWNLATFKEWYDGVINLYFDEEHIVKDDDVKARISGDQAEVDVTVHWQASWWEPGMAKSKRVDLVAAQKWRVRRSSKNDLGLEIIYHDAIARDFKFKEGSDPLPPRETNFAEPKDNILKDAYQQVCTSYHKIDDFRATLLGLLPLASGAGIFLLHSGSQNLSNETKEYLGPIGVFGMVVTLGLFAYEFYGIKKCDALIGAGKQIEGQLGIDGQFISRPRGVLRYINEPFAAGIIYPAVLAAWVYLALASTSYKGFWSSIAPLIALGIFVVGFLGMFFYNRRLERKSTKEQARSAEIRALTRLNRRILRAEEKGDTAILDQILADDFTMVCARGEQWTRKAFLETIPDNAGRNRTADDPQVRFLDGHSAVFTCRVTTKRDSDGNPSIGHFWNTRTFLRQEGAWRCVVWQVTEIPQA
jgi:hypothetical protein